MASTMSPANEPGISHKKKKKNLFASLFQKKTKNKSKEKASTLLEQNNNTTDIHVTPLVYQQNVTSPAVNDDSASYTQSTVTGFVLEPPSLEHPSVTSSANVEEPVARQEEAMALLLTNTGDQGPAVHSRSSSHSSGFDEISTSITECSCINEQVKTLALTPVDHIVASTIDECLDVPNDVTDSVSVSCDVIADKDEQQSTISNSSTVTDAIQANSDVNITCPPNEVTMAAQDTSSSPAAKNATMSDATAATLLKLREVTARIKAVKPNPAPATSRITTSTPRSGTLAFNSAFRQLLATETAARTATATTTPTSPEHLPALKNFAPKWHQPSAPVIAKTTAPILLRSNSNSSGSSAAAPARSVRRTRQSQPNTPPLNCTALLRSPYDSYDVRSCTSVSRATSQDDTDDVISSYSTTDVNNRSYVDNNVPYRPHYSSVQQLGESARDVMASAKAKKAEQRRRDVCTTGTRFGSDLHVDRAQPRDQLRHSVDQLNRVGFESRVTSSNSHVIGSTSSRRLPFAASSDALNSISKTRARPKSERYVELEQSFDRWRQQLVDATSSTSLHAIGRCDGTESDVPAINRAASTLTAPFARITESDMSARYDASGAMLHDAKLKAADSASRSNHVDSCRSGTLPPWQRGILTSPTNLPSETVGPAIAVPKSITAHIRRRRDISNNTVQS